MKKNIAILPGDGIGPEVMDQAIVVLDAIAKKFGHEFTYHHALVGGAAYAQYKQHLPQETIDTCRNSDAVLFGSVGGPVDQINDPQWKDCEKISLLGLRKTFDLGINLRPVKLYSQLSNLSMFKKEIIDQGIDILCVRELIGGIYFGEHKTFEGEEKWAQDIMEYTQSQIEVAAHAAFQAAQKRGKHVHSVDKANVLDCSKLWREVVEQVAMQYPDVTYEHILVDNCAMQLVKNPSQFDVILCENMFGDILSDMMSVFAGSLGMLPSASINKDGFGMYEPAGGSAQDIAGKGLANPIGQILSAAMMLLHSFDMKQEHDAIVSAIDTVLEKGIMTGDLTREKSVSTQEMGKAIAQYI